MVRRSIYVVSLSISFIFIVYQIYYYRLLQNNHNNGDNRDQIDHLSPHRYEQLEWADHYKKSSFHPAAAPGRPVVERPLTSKSIHQPTFDRPSTTKTNWLDEPEMNYTSIIGIGTELLSTYRNSFKMKQGLFQCLNQLEEISIHYFNDDYCDCSDGSDEPSTSACSVLGLVGHWDLFDRSLSPPSPSSWQKSSLKFHCRSCSSSNYEINYNRVNDGICDCCDGSDEWPLIADQITNRFAWQMTRYTNSTNDLPWQKCFRNV